MEGQNKNPLPTTTRQQLENWYNTMVTSYIKKEIFAKNKKSETQKNEIKKQLLKGDLEKLHDIFSQKIDKSNERPTMGLGDIVDLCGVIKEEIKQLK